MRLTFSQMQAQFLRNINQVGTAETSILNDFSLNLGQRYQLALAKLKNYRTVLEYPFSTVANQQFYPYPTGEVTIEGMYVSVNNVAMPLQIISDRFAWEKLNAIPIQASAVPQFYFPTRDSFGIWPIPQEVYSSNVSYHYRDRNLSVADYTTGTVQVQTGASATTIIGTGTTWTPAMVGRWFTVTDPTVPGQGYWYRVTAYTSATHLTLYQGWSGSAASGATYLIGETPEIPEEGHIVLVDGATADFYGGLRKDPTQAQWFINKFFTGDGTNTSREAGNTNIAGGLLGLMSRYNDRDDQRIVSRRPKLNPLVYQVWATSLS